jgi:hypothetical protein
MAILAVLAGLAIPTMLGRLEGARLPESGNQLRALLQFTRNTAMIDGLRYRIRFPLEDELDCQGESRQPLIEVEDDPLEYPGQYRLVSARWAEDVTLARGIRCARVRLGKPTIELLLGESQADEEREEELEESLEDEFAEGLPPLVFEPDGTCEWATFVLTKAPVDVAWEDLNQDDTEFDRLEIILDGVVGLVWLQRPLFEDELEMMRENGWPPVLRQDFLSPIPLTEDDVLEIREMQVRR